jgi:hypothetical protein
MCLIKAWINAIEAKFSAVVMPCSEEDKANFAALQLRGEALMWWDHFKTMQQGHAVTWDEFKQAFKSHHIPKGLMDRKIKSYWPSGRDLTRCIVMPRNSIAFVNMADITWILMQKR